MTMRQLVEKLIRRCGTTVTVYHEGIKTETRGIFMPTTSRSWQNMQHVYSPLGETPRGQYNYIGALEPVAEKGDVLEVGGRRYLLRRVEIVRDARGPVYRWGLGVERGGDDNWGSQV